MNPPLSGFTVGAKKNLQIPVASRSIVAGGIFFSELDFSNSLLIIYYSMNFTVCKQE